MKWTGAGIVGCLVALLAGAIAGQGAIDRRTWRDYGGGPDNARHSTLDRITKQNVGQLQVAWRYPTADNVSYVFGPLVADGVMYVLARNQSLVALDAATGREIWVHEGLQGIAPRGINYWQSADGRDRRLLFQRNNYLEALDARTGLPILTFGNQGAVNLREGLRRDVATVGRAQSSNPGKVFENLLLLGSATGENYMATPGDIRAFDVITGRLVWQFHTIPLPGEFGYETWPPDAYKYVGGANVWGEITVDAARGIAFFPTGSPTYDYFGADRHGANLFGTSLVALDARTGRRLWHFQMVHHDLWDYDNAAAPQLTTIRHNGRLRDVVVQAGKTGFLYVFDRVTGEPIWPIEERPVPPSDVPGEAAWPTQPFPTVVPPFTPQTLSVDDINPYVLTPDERAAWRERIGKARNRGLFTPPAIGVDTVSIPGAQGGANWGTTAAHPTDGLFYVLGITVPSIYQLSLEPPGRAGGAAPGRGGAGAQTGDIALGRSIYQQRCAACHGGDLRGVGTQPSLVDVGARISPEVLREVISAGRLSMPPAQLTAVEMSSLLAFLATPGVTAAGPASAPASSGPVVASGGTPGARAGGARGSGGMVGPAYPPGLPVPSVRYYTDYGMQNSLVKPPYSTLTAYDLNAGTIKWQIPAGGDDPRAVAEGATNTGYPRVRTGIVTTPTGLLFQAGLDGRLRAYDAENGRVLWAG
ncbi:MAG: PQQ-binding-like beta-propeller repeat protein, partial [Acidobacteria bacterium]|nr:PQQ-binding-like beta-propeller repeat protein [Acidobacteriota bacterium]